MSALRIIVFAKAPRPGLAKTRLIPALGAAGAAALAARMLAHTLDQALASGVGEVELCAAPAPWDATWDGIELPDGIARTAQGEGDLGERMARAARRAIEAIEAGEAGEAGEATEASRAAASSRSVSSRPAPLPSGRKKAAPAMAALSPSPVQSEMGQPWSRVEKGQAPSETCR